MERDCNFSEKRNGFQLNSTKMLRTTKTQKITKYDFDKKKRAKFHEIHFNMNMGDNSLEQNCIATK